MIIRNFSEFLTQSEIKTPAMFVFKDVKLGIFRVCGIYHGHILGFKVFN